MAADQIAEISAAVCGQRADADGKPLPARPVYTLMVEFAANTGLHRSELARVVVWPKVLEMAIHYLRRFFTKPRCQRPEVQPVTNMPTRRPAAAAAVAMPTVSRIVGTSFVCATC